MQGVGDDRTNALGRTRDQCPLAVKRDRGSQFAHEKNFPALPQGTGARRRDARVHYGLVYATDSAVSRATLPPRTSSAAALPPPEPDALAHGERVRAHLVAALQAAGGWLSFARYMELALYAPGLGYYSAGSTKLGPAGDFITAPELTPLFGQALARQLAPLLQALARPVLLEPGAGTGALAASLLPALAELDALPTRYLVLEPSAELAARQRARLAERLPAPLLARVAWVQSPPEGEAAGILVANEVLDALPVERFRVSAEGPLQLGVALDEAGGFCWRTAPFDPAFAASVRAHLGEALDGLPAGAEGEFCPLLAPWLATLLGGFERGAALFIDYGLPRAELYLPERTGGTLRCHYRQRAHDDPLVLPGLQDITAWVDFTAVAEAAVAAGWEVAGFTTQAHYLLDGGLEGLLPEAGAGDASALQALQAVKTLVLPGEMGERFRVMALVRGLETTPPGFGLRDLRDRL
ncbi:MAG: SAM-dependent methyltransferase [Gammaproteobacteria bacterium]|nr:SAM-dependent methyltransferase [Gammaproteobacteria bacterium]